MSGWGIFVREVWPEILNHLWMHVPQLRRPEVQDAILKKMTGKGNAEAPNTTPKPDPYGFEYPTIEETPMPDFSVALLTKEAKPAPLRPPVDIDKKNLYYFGGGVGVGISIGYYIWGRGGGN